MTTLDALFNKAAQDTANAKFGIVIHVNCTVTSNQTAGFDSQNTNKASAAAPVVLNYSPQKQTTFNHEIRVLPASFSSAEPAIAIIAPAPLQTTNYNIELSGTSFTPETPAPGDNTGIVYGVPLNSVAGSPFFTLSLCNYDAVPNTE